MNSDRKLLFTLIALLEEKETEEKPTELIHNFLELIHSSY